MQIPGRVLLRAAGGADPLPRVEEIHPLFDYGAGPRRAQLMLIVGDSGSMKTMLATFMADRMGVPTLYFCADSDPFTATTRLAALRTGQTVADVVEGLRGPLAGWYEETTAESGLRFCFDPCPSLDDMVEEITAYVEYWDDLPEVIVVDNVMNIDTGMEEYIGYKAVTKELHRLARETGASVWALHHTTEGSDSPAEPRPRHRISGKVSQMPELIWSVAFDPVESVLRVAVVKNRNGRADASARSTFSFTAVPERAAFAAHIPRIGVWHGQHAK